jgi:micrococcal nuclease
LYNELSSRHQFFTDPSVATSNAEKAKVTDIVDGDTIKVLSSGKTYTVRYIGIDTPEIKHQNGSTDQPYGQEAKTVNAWLLAGKDIYLKKDVTETDKYGRLLRYIYLEDGTMINDVLIRMGYAHILTIPPNVAFQSEFLKAQRAAREERLNLWR